MSNRIRITGAVQYMENCSPAYADFPVQVSIVVLQLSYAVCSSEPMSRLATHGPCGARQAGMDERFASTISW